VGKARGDLRNHVLVIDLKNVTAISQEGENVLLELMNERIKFRCGVFTKTSFGNSLTEHAGTIKRPSDEGLQQKQMGKTERRVRPSAASLLPTETDYTSFLP
jgi:hypothetical protein